MDKLEIGDQVRAQKPWREMLGTVISVGPESATRPVEVNAAGYHFFYAPDELVKVEGYHE